MNGRWLPAQEKRQKKKRISLTLRDVEAERI